MCGYVCKSMRVVSMILFLYRTKIKKIILKSSLYAYMHYGTSTVCIAYAAAYSATVFHVYVRVCVNALFGLRGADGRILQPSSSLLLSNFFVSALNKFVGFDKNLEKLFLKIIKKAERKQIRIATLQNFLLL